MSIAQEAPLWMRYPAISPDGNNIVFAYQGDLFLVPSEGGQAQHLTVHTAYEFMPLWSPDGEKIAFASDRFGNFDVFIITAAGGQAQRLTSFSRGELPCSFTPDGSTVLFSATIDDQPNNVQFPSGVLSELYSVPIEGGKVRQVLSTPAEMAVYDKEMKTLLYHDRKGYENSWRKHHTSVVARDIWHFDVNSSKHTKQTTFAGEDRNPVFAPGDESMFYLSEQNGSFNVYHKNFDEVSESEQLTNHKHHPVRFLSASDSGVLCYSYHGEIYLKEPGNDPEKVDISISIGQKENNETFLTMKKEATEMALSPTGKEIALIVRGEVFVTSVDFETTKRITQTPQQERSVSFSPDGRTLLYASERNNSWNLYRTNLVRENEKLFSLSTLLKEEVILETEEETFQPHFSPDGKEVAYLEEREALKVLNLESGQIRTILEGTYNYSYSDGDQWYQWSPDGNWFLVEYSPNAIFMGDIGLVNASGADEPINLTNSGYSDWRPKWMMDGNVMVWYSDKYGFRSHGSWGAHGDVFAMFFNQDAFDQFKLSKEEYKLLNPKKNIGKKNEVEENETDSLIVELADSIGIDLDRIEDRKARLTINSSNLADFVLTPDGEKLFYLSKFEEGYDLWVNKLKDKETKLLMKLKGNAGSLQLDKKGEFLYLISNKKIIKISTKDKPEKKDIAFKAEFNLDKFQEKAYMFDHVWRQVKKKFYRPDLHGIDWDFYREEYHKFLPHINNNYDFAEMLSEMLGELNGSHTGSGYRASSPNGDATAKLGIFIDPQYERDGIRILEIIDKSPIIQDDSKIENGHIIEMINGEPILPTMNYWELLNHQAGKNTLLSMYDPETGMRWEETIKPISIRQENELLYQRWIKNRRAETDSLSNGRIGYVHVRGMNSRSFREFYSEVLGRNYHKEALIVDTRFNGGGWLHDDLATFLNGKKYVDFYPRGEHFGHDPMNKWIKPSVVLVSESNYSDAHGFPYAYKSLGIGELVGMPVPGTMTAVWWETLQDKTLYFGIPQVGTKDMDGNYLENQQLEPDHMVRQDYDIVIQGRDQQLEKAVEVLLQNLKK